MKGRIRKDRVVIVSAIIIAIVLAVIFATQFIYNNKDSDSKSVGQSSKMDTEETDGTQQTDDTQQTDNQQDGESDSSSSEEEVNEINVTQNEAEEIVKEAQKDNPDVNVVESEQRQTTGRNYYIVYSQYLKDDGTQGLKMSYVDTETGEILYEVEE